MCGLRAACVQLRATLRAACVQPACDPVQPACSLPGGWQGCTLAVAKYLISLVSGCVQPHGPASDQPCQPTCKPLILRRAALTSLRDTTPLVPPSLHGQGPGGPAARLRSILGMFVSLLGSLTEAWRLPSSRTFVGLISTPDALGSPWKVQPAAILMGRRQGLEGLGTSISVFVRGLCMPK